MTLTLVEAAKGESNVFVRGVISTFMENMRLTQIVPYRDITGRLDGVKREAVLPDAETRAVNEAFTRSEGRIEEEIQALKIYGGDIGIDPYILETETSGQAARQVSLKIKGISNRWTLDFFKGDGSVNSRDFDGLQNRLDGFNIVSQGGPAAAEAPLSLTTLDEAIERCHNPQFLAMGRRTAILLTQAARTQTVTGFLVHDRNDLGKRAMFYNDLEVVVVTDNSNNDNILDFTETANDGGTLVASSIYVMGMGDEGVEGIQNGGFRVRNLGEDNATPRQDTRVEWYNNFHINHDRSVVRCNNFSNAAFVT